MSASRLARLVGHILLLSSLGLITGLGSCNGGGNGLHPADNYGPKDTWFHLVYYTKIDFKGDRKPLVLNGAPQDECRNVKSIRHVRNGRSVVLYDYRNPAGPLPAGMKVYIYWGKNCPQWKPVGVITVPENTSRIEVPRLNKPSDNYQVFNNFNQQDGGKRRLNGHTFGVRWVLP